MYQRPEAFEQEDEHACTSYGGRSREVGAARRDPHARWVLLLLHGPRRHQPNPLIRLLYAGAVSLALGVTSLGIGLLTA